MPKTEVGDIISVFCPYDRNEVVLCGDASWNHLTKTWDDERLDGKPLYVLPGTLGLVIGFVDFDGDSCPVAWISSHERLGWFWSREVELVQ